MNLFHRTILVGMAIGFPLALPAQSVARAVIEADHQSAPARAPKGLGAVVTINFEAVPLRQALEAIARQASLSITTTDAVTRLSRRVTIPTRRLTASEAFNAVLEGTGVRMTVAPDGEIFFALTATRPRKVQGTVTGRVTDAATKRPVAGASVYVENGNRGTQTTEDGTFNIASVPTGAQVIVVRRIGYAKVSRSVTVNENATTTLDVALEASVNALDQVVVTGTVTQTELKAVPSAITVVTAKQLEERGITKIDQLFRGDIPGLFAHNQGSSPTALLDEVTMYSRGATALSSSSAGITGDPAFGVSFLTNAMKVYIDGIELADAKYLSQIDPKSIERIEILTGPQASTIYGSNAINGVMQVFTKRGISARPQIALTLLSGWVENNFSPARTPQHDYSAQLNGIEGRMSYQATGSWNYVGPWTPAKQTTRVSGSGGARLELRAPGGPVTVDGTIRRGITHNRQYGSVYQRFTEYGETGWNAYSNVTNGLSNPTTHELRGQTLGMTIGYAPSSWWSHEAGIGQDVSEADVRYTARGYATVSDTTLRLQQNHVDRRSFRYTTTARAAFSERMQATVTLGADSWQNLSSSMIVQPQTLTGSLTGTTTVSRQPGHNTGGFLQTQLGLLDRLFLTYGLRAEWNPDFGEDAEPNYAPRYGLAYTHDVGGVTAKVRASYGRSTRPPQPKLRAAQKASQFGFSAQFIDEYGNIDYYLENAELGPENQQGWEGGLELYLGAHGSLVVTRYNQTIDGLIANPRVDSARSFAVNPNNYTMKDPVTGYGYYSQYQYVNLGSIRNQGWELQGSATLGPLSGRGTYSWTKSRTLGVDPKYRAFFNPVSYPQYQPGATFKYLPEHTWALGVTYANAKSMIGLNLTGTGEVANFQDDFFIDHLHTSIRLPHNRQNMGIAGNNKYVSFNDSYALADLVASHRFATRVEGLFQVQNLTDRYMNDYWSIYATMGRQTKIGLRIR